MSTRHLRKEGLDAKMYLIWVHASIVPIIGTMRKTIASPQYRKLVLWLKNNREEQGLSMRALADRLEAPHSFVQKIEMLERRLDVMEYVRYCAALGIDPKEGLDLIM